MKICYIGDGCSIHIQRWVQWYAKNGHEVHLITERGPKIEGVFVHKISANRGPLAFSKKVLQVRKLVSTIKPDIVHGHYIIGPGLLAILSGAPTVVLTPWGSDIVADTETFFIRSS